MSTESFKARETIKNKRLCSPCSSPPATVPPWWGLEVSCLICIPNSNWLDPSLRVTTAAVSRVLDGHACLIRSHETAHVYEISRIKGDDNKKKDYDLKKQTTKKPMVQTADDDQNPHKTKSSVRLWKIFTKG